MSVETKSEDTKTTESVLFVDDEKLILSSIKRLIRPLGLNAYFAESGAEGLKILEEQAVDLVVSDMRMPQMDGAEFLARVKQRWPDTIRMLLTGYADISSTVDALNNGGIYRYISKPWNDDELKEIIQDGLKLKRLEREKIELQDLTRRQNEQLHDLNANLEKKVEARTEEIRQTSEMLDLAFRDLRESYDSFVQVFSSFTNRREVLQKSESQIVADLAKRIATALKLKDESVQRIYHAALLHQVGKMGLPDRILLQAEDQMNTADKHEYQQYSIVGEAALTAIDGFGKTAALIRNHTEYFDGSGYPDQLKGNKARSGARIIRTVCDYIGLQTGVISTYKMSADEAFATIKSQSGRRYDPIVVKCLDHFRQQFDVSSIYSKEIQLDSYALQPGMRLTRDLIDSRDLLLISKGYTLNAGIIDKVQTLEQKENAKFKIFVARDQESEP